MLALEPERVDVRGVRPHEDERDEDDRDEDDVDGTVDAFIVQAVSAGTLTLGGTAGTATPFAAGTNDTIQTGTNAYWTPANNVFGLDIDAFTVKAKDDDAALLQVSDRTEPDVGLGELLHGDRRLDSGRDTGLLEGVADRQGVDHGGEHPHVVGRGRIHALGSL